MMSLKGALSLMVGLVLFSQNSNAQNQQFFNCVSQLTPVCDSYGTPAELVGPFNYPFLPGQDLYHPSPYYPGPSLRVGEP